ncbi:uncharacterized protein LOC112599977 [Melanaphis sacchari]|uniref:uncharacterized protein LOC112599977 n=1 Tax=Melanaphis sacchari TaxID=742174 RepID=UPI000DC135BC|nr:uncharacterized protein LOC112599977 [Melanaphis sacchari]
MKNTGKRAKIEQMLRELNDIRRKVEEDIQYMENAVSHGTAPTDVKDTADSRTLAAKFDNLYYELAAFADVQKISLSPVLDQSLSTSLNKTINNGAPNVSHYQLPKRTFPIFSGIITEWQGFDDLFNSIMSHAPDLPDVERFEFLKTSLQGDAKTVIAHLPLTSANYHSAWEILRARYGNKRDLARIHIQALLAPHTVSSTDAFSIQSQINSILKNTAALDNLNLTTRQWSPILVHIFEQHLDYELRARWELILGDRHQPQLTEFVDFLRSHVRAAEARSGHYSPVNSGVADSVRIKSKPPPSKGSRPTATSKVLVTTAKATSSLTTSCLLCKQAHSVRKCAIFDSQSPSERFQTAKKLQLCINCLGSGHTLAACPSKHTCMTCKKQHHTLLHFPDNTTMGDIIPNATTMFTATQRSQSILLSTLLVSVPSSANQNHTLRALLDTGSQVSFITKQCADRLFVTRRRCTTKISVFSGSRVNVVSGMTTITISPVNQSEPSISLDVLIVSKITDVTPQEPLHAVSWPHINQLELADPTFHTPGHVDILLGADVAPSIFTGARISGHQHHPTAFGTVFGWVLMGPTAATPPKTVTSMLVTTETTLEQSLSKFWEMEEPPHIHHLSPDEVHAERIFTSSVKRLASGRFSIALPLKHPHPILGDSYSMAQTRFRSLEHRLSQNEDLSKQYKEFMRDYLASQHMELVPMNQRVTPYCYYIPHHCIMRPESKTTKLRVVFDASAVTTAGQSLNVNLYTGRKLQQDLPRILIRARVHKVLFTADIKQMYRQIEIRAEDRDYLRILWRFESDEPITTYRLCTVTYDTSSAPHQALRTLQHLAKIEETKFPLAAQILMQDTFVDDILTGADTPDAALVLQSQLIALCNQGQFQLRKWASNSPVILQAVSENERSMSTDVLFNDELEAGLKILGMQWNPKQDHFSYTFQCPQASTTKRSILSDLARIFDPLGFLSPVTFLAKHMMQLLWTSGVGWDDPVPEQVRTMWQRYQSEIQCIQHLKIPRRITTEGVTQYEFHVFSDSSEKGYAAAVYLRCETDNQVTCNLITAKSKVSPLKRVTIPRLELCGAVLAAQLLNYVYELLKKLLSIDAMHAWTDSTTTLAWIQSSPHRWATFIANRTSQIQSLTPPSLWRYVPTSENPVDCASRGLYPTELLKHPMWWNGPAFLAQHQSTWPSSSASTVTDLEARTTVLVITPTTTFFDSLFLRHSSLQKIIRIISYCKRVFANIKPTIIEPSTTELNNALEVIILAVQKQTFADEFMQLRDPTHQGTSKLRGLNPFIDNHGTIRVGGRLTYADLPYEQKHPILLPKTHRLTDLLIDNVHHQHKHPGAKTLQCIIQQQYWIIASRQVIKSRLRHCIACYRIRPRGVQPVMGNLPKFRLQQVKPFTAVGVDYAGPIVLKSSPTRRTDSCHAYICLFVCMATKALHLELASDLSTETFLMAFSRFISRRGPIQQMHSDCGTNFVGASKLFETVNKFTQSAEHQKKCRDFLTTRNITWHFNPPSAPHFGGLWEAGVKSTKTLIHRSIGLHRLKYEELSTLLTRIEATLNSRPLSALSPDPLDFDALTPSHFLTLMPSTANVEPNLDNVPTSHYKRWRLISEIHTHFWKRWKNEYLQTLNFGEMVSR